MRKKATWAGLVSTLLAGTLLAAGPAAAEDPVLVIHGEGGEFASYPLAEIERILFVGDSLEVASGTGTDRYPLASIERIDFPSVSTGVGSPGVIAALPRLALLFPNRPNPFNPETRIDFRLERGGRVELKVYGVTGRHVRTLVEGDRPAGAHDAVWDGRDDGGRPVAAGIYFYRLTAPGIRESRRMVLLP